MCFLTLWLLAGNTLSAAYGIDVAFQVLGTRMTETMQQVSTILGPLVTLFGGGRVAWKMSHQETFTTPLLMAIIGIALFAGSGGINFAGGMDNVTGGISTITNNASLVLGGLVVLIGGSITAWKAAHREPFTTPLLFSIVAAAVAAATVRAVGGR